MSSAEARIEEPDAVQSPRKSASDDPRARLSAKVAEKDEASLTVIAIRDIAVVAALLSLFGGAQTWALTSGLAVAALLSAVDGLLVGAAVAAVFHEWGHFVGARLAGGHSPLKPFGQLFPIFDFDYVNNDARSFDWMSIGGNVGDLSVVLFFFFALPLATVGTTALVAGAVGFAVFAGAIEFPVIRKARAGMTGIDALSTIPRDFQHRYSRWGVAAAAVTFTLL